ncbi:MAG: hypothetical protein HeimC3_08580 [Candidatus Heimdallarchaeota archaeon LC_3]|nr:MAG: hypothetical protein HeimC3_24210 [Candidatus Heimdallarchaeota archaeon LC_3]OLS26539.1 MAG: hypothetical protein HeimC3_08580 [Candidatus Heimdallarchaeota archaeon LC_3]
MNSIIQSLLILVGVLLISLSAVMAQDDISQYELSETDLPTDYERISSTVFSTSSIPTIQQTWKTPLIAVTNPIIGILLTLADYGTVAGADGAMLGAALNEGDPVTVTGVDRVINES